MKSESDNNDDNGDNEEDDDDDDELYSMNKCEKHEVDMCGLSNSIPTSLSISLHPRMARLLMCTNTSIYLISSSIHTNFGLPKFNRSFFYSSLSHSLNFSHSFTHSRISVIRFYIQDNI